MAKKKKNKRPELKPYDDTLVPKVKVRIDNIRVELESDLPSTLYGIDGGYYNLVDKEDEGMQVGRDPNRLAMKGCESSGDRCEIGIYRLVDVRVYHTKVTDVKFEDDVRSDDERGEM